MPQLMVVARVWAKNAAGDDERRRHVLVLWVVLHVALRRAVSNVVIRNARRVGRRPVR
jgi:hypothetical protein